MKRLALLAFAALSTFVFAVARADAQESFAPLVQKETTAIVRLDLSLIDSDIVSTQLTKVAGAAIDYFIADAQQAKETKNALPLITALATQYFNAFVQPFKDAGVTEAYVVIDKSNDSENPLYPYLAIPTANMTEDQIKEARAALSTLNKNTDSALKYRFSRNGFLFAVFTPSDLDEDKAKSYVKKRFTSMQTVDATKFVDAFQLVGNKSLVIGASLPTNVQVGAEEIAAALAANPNEELQQEIESLAAKSLDVQKEFAELIRFAAWKVDLANLETVSLVQMKSDADAAKYLETIVSFKTDVAAFIDAVFEKAVAGAAPDADAPDANALNDLKQAILAFTNVVFDDIQANGSVVSFTFNEEFIKKHDAEIKAIVAAAQQLAPTSDENADDSDDVEIETDDSDVETLDESETL